MNINFETLQSVCNHQGAILNGVKSCNFKNGIPAHCWDDWQPCTLSNCYLVNKNKKQQITTDNNNQQQNIFDLIGG